ncbi:MAG: hypothetical protein L0387_15985 [Acidobacteria bacterium]|nr:hypothetical protein [Acidobacteriota bacterium]MCI0723969.1 hypothetical protein [Acidobacteriota bacterium]
MENGSICWQVLLRDNEVDTLSRRTIADQCRRIIDAYPIAILPKEIQKVVSGLQESSYGVNRVAVTLEDGTVYSGVFVAWRKEVIKVSGYDSIPFDVSKVVSVTDDLISASNNGVQPTAEKRGG